MTTNPHIRAGSLPPTQLHRVDASLLSDNRVVEQFGEPAPLGLMKYADSPMPYTDIREVDENADGPEEMIALLIMLVLCIGALAIWRFA